MKQSLQFQFFNLSQLSQHPFSEFHSHSLRTSSLMAADSEFARDRYLRLSKLAEDTSVPFPREKLPKEGKEQRIVLISCGSFSPVTNMHLRMFEEAKDFAKEKGLPVVAGYMSPVSSSYKKKGLVSGEHRINMCKLAIESSNWIMVDDWETNQKEYVTTNPVLEHFTNCLNANLPEGDPGYRVVLLCGADMLESMNTPGVWAEEDVTLLIAHDLIKDIVSRYGLMVFEREGSDIQTIVSSNPILNKHKENIHPIQKYINDGISSTKIREAIAKGRSVKYLMQDGVEEYIRKHSLYKE